MTDHTTAAQAAMQEAVRNAIRKAYDDGYNDAKMAPDNCSTYCVQRAEREGTAALLSKLRAPVADERQGDIAAALQDSAYCAGLQRGFALGNHNDNDGLRQALESRDGYVKTIKEARAALSAQPGAQKEQSDA